MAAVRAFAASASVSLTFSNSLLLARATNEILSDYGFLEREDIFAALAYAAPEANHTVLLRTREFESRLVD